MTSSAPIVEMRGISVTFPGVKALDDVDFRLMPGEVHALMGQNGAGKSTLIKALTGVHATDAGDITIGGERRRLHGTADAQAAGIAVVYQEVNLCTNLTIGENVMLGHEVRGRLGIDWKATHLGATEALANLGLGALDTRLPLSAISLAMQQLVAISRAMVVNSKVLILDEPTSSLDAAEVGQLFAVIRRLRDAGVAILFVSHFLDQVYEISDRITVLRNGRYIGEHETAALDRGTLIAEMIGKELAVLRSIDAARRHDRADRDETPTLEATGLGRRGAIEPTDLQIFRGEVVGFAGLLGSGRTELARLLYGADRADSGSLEFDGDTVALNSPAAGLSYRIAYSSENRRDEGIIADLSVRENLVLAVQARRGWMRPLPRREQNEIVDKYIAELDIRPADPDIPVRNLSGGNQQKVLLGRWLATRPDILILDEPTRGIDVGAKAEIYALIEKLAAEGRSMIVVSSELPEILRVADRVLVIREGRIAGVLERDSLSEEAIVALAVPQSSPTATSSSDLRA